MKLKIKELSELTVEQYQKIEKCFKDNGDSEFTNQFIVSVVYELPLRDIQQMSKEVVDVASDAIKQTISSRPKLVERFTMDGIEYGFIPNLEDITSGEYSDIETYLPNVEDYNKCLAVLYRPIKQSHKDKYTIDSYTGTSSTAHKMKSAPANILVSALVFFWTLEKELLNATLVFIKNQLEELKASEQKRNTQVNGDGILHLTDLVAETSLKLEKLQSEGFMSA